MKTRILLLTVMSWLLAGRAADAQVIIVNRGVKLTEISKDALRNIFLGVSEFYRDGGRAMPATLKGGPVHESFLKTYIGKSDAQLRAAWRAQVFAGHGTMPQAFDSEAALIEYVASVPGAIGYVSAPVKNENIKLVTVQ